MYLKVRVSCMSANADCLRDCLLYHRISHKSKFLSIHTKAFRRVCLTRTYKCQVGYCMVYLKRELHNSFKPCQRNYRGQHNQCDICAAHYGTVGCNTVKYTLAFMCLDWLHVFSMVRYKTISAIHLGYLFAFAINYWPILLQHRLSSDWIALFAFNSLTPEWNCMRPNPILCHFLEYFWVSKSTNVTHMHSSQRHKIDLKTSLIYNWKNEGPKY